MKSVEGEEREEADLLEHVQLLHKLVLHLEEVDQEHFLLWTDSALYPPWALQNFFLRTCLPQKLQFVELVDLKSIFTAAPTVGSTAGTGE